MPKVSTYDVTSLERVGVCKAMTVGDVMVGYWEKISISIESI